MFTHLFLYRSSREELRGLPRANNAKDVDWSKVANTISLETTTKPPPIKISVSEVLKRVRPLKQNTESTALLTAVDPHGKSHSYRLQACNLRRPLCVS
jgi:chitinase